ncbi:hypothetical protein JOQ06_025348 [Pogonophryne albipinna]|uniref:Uncharacterized protein n=1 Tax=Pogonophryne albipinna TaxID=1090488 RepID=A0AAD6ASC3_9TELE|nr:hypothetical protein JOQ06_025348 [Pogonophryne albipinna]
MPKHKKPCKLFGLPLTMKLPSLIHLSLILMLTSEDIAVSSTMATIQESSSLKYTAIFVPVAALLIIICGAGIFFFLKSKSDGAQIVVSLSDVTCDP